MTTGVERDLVVDVLVVGAGIPALQIARALHPTYSVCVVSEPGVPYESYESAGRFSAGYMGNDVSRIEPARRGAAHWRRWAESHRIPHDPAPSVHVLRADEEAAWTALWSAAGLDHGRLAAAAVPAPLAGGVAAGQGGARHT